MSLMGVHLAAAFLLFATMGCGSKVGFVELAGDFAPVQGQALAMSRPVVVGGAPLRIVFELRDQLSGKVISRVGGYSLNAGMYSLNLRRAIDVNGGDGLWVGIAPPGDSLIAHVDGGKPVKVEVVELRSSQLAGKIELGMGGRVLATYKYKVEGGPTQIAEVIMSLEER